MAEYTEIQRRQNAAAAAAKSKEVGTSLGVAAGDAAATAAINAANARRAPNPDSGAPKEPDYTGMDMVARGNARRKYLADLEAHEKKEGEKAALPR